MKSFEREVNQDLWFYIMDEKYAGQHPFENDTFQIKPYSFGDETNDYNFYHKPSGFKLSWYKYPLRAADANMNISHKQFRAILYDCMNSVHPYVTVAIDKWWEVKNG